MDEIRDKELAERDGRIEELYAEVDDWREMYNQTEHERCDALMREDDLRLRVEELEAELEAEREEAAFWEMKCYNEANKRTKAEQCIAVMELLHTEREGEAFFEAECNRLRQALAEIERTHMKLPVDAEGVPIRIGDVLEDAKFSRISLVVDGYTSELKDGEGPIHPTTSQGNYESEWFREKEYRHVKPDTVESELAQFLTACGDDDPHYYDEQIAEFAERIRKACNG